MRPFTLAALVLTLAACGGEAPTNTNTDAAPELGADVTALDTSSPSTDAPADTADASAMPADVADAPDTLTDPCGGLCGAGTTCQGGRCVAVDASTDAPSDTPRDTGCPPNAERTSSGSCRCVAGFTLCGESCVDLYNDNAHCGACTAVCSNGICALGRCVAVAPPPDAGSDVTDATVDRPDLCAGACSMLANVVRATCAAVNRCSITMCVTGFADCDRLDLNGCETDTRTSREHCGRCGNYCGSRVCVNGDCF